MLDRFQGDNGRRLLTQALLEQRLVQGDQQLALELCSAVSLILVPAGQHLIRQGASDNDIYFIIAGNFEIRVNSRSVGRRAAGNHVGEMAAIELTHTRSADVTAVQDSVVAKLAEPEFSALATRFPMLYKQIARELARRLMERNKLVNASREKTKVMMISSAEALPISRMVQSAFEHDDFLVTLWTDGVFKVAHYPLEVLEQQLDISDFAIAIAHSDDLTHSRGRDWPAPRDNVVFELGLFVGRLGRKRAILMEPREDRVKLPSDLAGIITVPYRFKAGPDAEALLAPACNELRKHILALGPNN